MILFGIQKQYQYIVSKEHMRILAKLSHCARTSASETLLMDILVEELNRKVSKDKEPLVLVGLKEETKMG